MPGAQSAKRRWGFRVGPEAGVSRLLGWMYENVGFRGLERPGACFFFWQSWLSLAAWGLLLSASMSSTEVSIENCQKK